MVDFLQTQYSSRQGEIGDFFHGQSHLQIFHQGLCEAENVAVKAAGNIERRDPVKYLCELPGTTGGQYKIVNAVANGTNLGLFFTENKLTVKRYNGYEPEQLFDIDTTYSLDRMNYSWHCLAKGNRAEDMDDAIVFCNHNHRPLGLTIANDGTHQQDYIFHDLNLDNMPMTRVRKDDLSGTAANTGVVECRIVHSQWVLSTTNSVFNDDSWIGAEFEIGGARWRINSIFPNAQGKNVSCSLLKGSVVAYSNVAPADIFFHKGYERVATDAKGWFDCCAFCNGRLFFAKAKAHPNVIVGSVFNHLLDYDLNIAEDEDAVFAELPLESGEYITSIKCTSSIYAFTNKGLFVCPRVDVTPKTFTFTRAQTEGGVDAFTETMQLAENGLIGISSQKSKIYYYQFSDEQNAFRAAPISPVMEPKMIAQSTSVFNATVVDEGKTIGQNFYYISSEFDIVKVLLTFEKDIVPGYTRYDFDDRYIPTKLYSFNGRLYVVFLDTLTQKCYLTYLNNALTDNGAPLFRERPCVDFYIEVGARDDVEDKKEIILQDWINAKDNLYFISNSDYYAAKVTWKQDNVYQCPVDMVNGHIGVFFTPYIETMETSGTPETVGGSAFGKWKCIKSLAFGAQTCFSELQLAVIEAISSDIPERKETPVFFRYLDAPNNAPQYIQLPFCDIPGARINPMLCMKQSKPGIFYFSGYSLTVGMAGGVLKEGGR